MNRINGIKAVAIDLDGVMYRGKTPIAGSARAIEEFRRKGLRILFITNNAGKKVGQVLHRIRAGGVRVHRDELLTSSQATAFYLMERYGRRKNVFVIGGHGLRQQLLKQGFKITKKHDAKIVVVSRDAGFSYKKLEDAFYNIQNGAIFVATNEDGSYPVEDGLQPGAGAMVGALKACVGGEPDVVIGKPHEPIMKIALEKLETKAKNTLFIGDRLSTDILAGNKIGAKTALVLTGVTSLGQAKKARGKHKPGIIAKNLLELAKRL